MKVFLTYASEQKAIAEATAFSLRSRGYDVFLDKDDLPPGRSYDEQIETGIKASDYLVFLISPQSVQQGRYTRTELEYARRKWRHPDGRILPVMVQPTAMTDVPEFLRAVTILEPKGNIAAEIGAHVAATETLDARNLMLWFVGAAAVSGVLSYFAMFMPGATALNVFFKGENLYPGLCFGIALCVPLFWRMSVPVLRLFVVLAAVQISWQLAVHAATLAEEHTTVRDGRFQFADQMKSRGETSESKQDGGDGSSASPSGTKLFEPDKNIIIPGLAGGLVGGFGTWLGLCVAHLRLRRLEAGLLTTITGGLAGLALPLVGLGGLMLVFLIWQTAVAAALAFSITRAK